MGPADSANEVRDQSDNHHSATDEECWHAAVEQDCTWNCCGAARSHAKRDRAENCCKSCTGCYQALPDHERKYRASKSSRCANFKLRPHGTSHPTPAYHNSSEAVMTHLAIISILYFLPTIIASNRGHGVTGIPPAQPHLWLDRHRLDRPAPLGAALHSPLVPPPLLPPLLLALTGTDAACP